MHSKIAAALENRECGIFIFICVVRHAAHRGKLN